MNKVSQLAHYFEKKYAQQFTQLDMGTLEDPNLNNIVKNIQALIKAFNTLSGQVQEQKNSVQELETILNEFEQNGIQL